MQVPHHTRVPAETINALNLVLCNKLHINFAVTQAAHNFRLDTSTQERGKVALCPAFAQGSPRMHHPTLHD